MLRHDPGGSGASDDQPGGRGRAPAPLPAGAGPFGGPSRGRARTAATSPQDGGPSRTPAHPEVHRSTVVRLTLSPGIADVSGLADTSWLWTGHLEHCPIKGYKTIDSARGPGGEPLQPGSRDPAAGAGRQGQPDRRHGRHPPAPAPGHQRSEPAPHRTSWASARPSCSTSSRRPRCGRGYFHEYIEVSEDGALAPALALGPPSCPVGAWTRGAASGRVIRRALGVLKAFTLRIPNGPELSIDVDAVWGPADSGELGADLAGLFVEVGRLAQDHHTGILLSIDELHYVDRPTFTASDRRVAPGLAVEPPDHGGRRGTAHVGGADRVRPRHTPSGCSPSPRSAPSPMRRQAEAAPDTVLTAPDVRCDRWLLLCSQALEAHPVLISVFPSSESSGLHLPGTCRRRARPRSTWTTSTRSCPALSIAYRR